MTKKITTVQLELTGNHEAVMEVVSLAIAEGVVSKFEAQTTWPNGSSAIVRRPLQNGDRVKVTGSRTDYDIRIGDVGRILEVKRAGKGHQAKVRWDDGTESLAPGSLLKKV